MLLPSQPGRTLILASASPRRKELLANAGFSFHVITPDVDESAIALAIYGEKGGASAPLDLHERFVRAAAVAKARAVAAILSKNQSADIIGGDTVIVHSLKNPESDVLAGKRCAPMFGLMGKPDDAADARRMLSILSGSSHFVLSGASVVRIPGEVEISDCSSTEVVFRAIDDHEMDEYIESKEWEGKAGAYAVQGRAEAFVVRLNGDWDTVVGMNVESVRRMLNTQ
jgi:septum formation protein